MWWSEELKRNTEINESSSVSKTSLVPAAVREPADPEATTILECLTHTELAVCCKYDTRGSCCICFPYNTFHFAYVPNLIFVPAETSASSCSSDEAAKDFIRIIEIIRKEWKKWKAIFKINAWDLAVYQSSSYSVFCVSFLVWGKIDEATLW